MRWQQWWSFCQFLFGRQGKLFIYNGQGMEPEKHLARNTESDGKAGWSPVRRLGFRIVAAFAVLALTYHYSPWGPIPWVGGVVDAAVQKPVTAATAWLMTHGLHVAG